jgi:hypothetical protein
MSCGTKPSNIPLQPTVKKLRFLPSAELARWASIFASPLFRNDHHKETSHA